MSMKDVKKIHSKVLTALRALTGLPIKTRDIGQWSTNKTGWGSIQPRPGWAVVRLPDFEGGTLYVEVKQAAIKEL